MADTAFASVIRHCKADRRSGPPGSWINEDIIQAYTELHRRGIAHSVEVWISGQLVGGLYGLWMNGIFCGESMFSLVADASKTALIALGGWMKHEGHRLIDTQLLNPHLESMGAEALARDSFEHLLPKRSEKLEIINLRGVEWGNYLVRKTPGS